MSKGISPLIATVILIAFTVAIAAIASTFFIGFTRETTADTEEQGEEVRDCANAVIEVLNFTVSSTNLIVTVAKEGSYDFTDVDFAVRNTSTSGLTNYATNLRLNDTNSVTSVTLTGAHNITNGTYEVTATTECPGRSSTLRNESGTLFEAF